MSKARWATPTRTSSSIRLEAVAGADRKWPAFADFRVNLADQAKLFLLVAQRHPDAAARQPQPEDGDGASAAAPYDGGFCFSPVVLAANKGREPTGADGGNYFRSDTAATCDGVLALLAAGVAREDERVVKAAEWLAAHDRLDDPQGVPQEHPKPWGDAIRFDHYAVRAEAYAALDWPGEWRARLASAVAKWQAADGSFRNVVSPLMKEDDPLLTTALAVVVLAHCVE